MGRPKETYTGIAGEFSSADLAKLFGITANYINKITTEGVIVRTARGRFDGPTAVQAIVAQKLKTQANKFSADGTSKARIADAKAEMSELRLRQAKGELVNAGRVTALFGHEISIAKSRLLSIAVKVAPRLGTVKNAVEAKELIENEILEALTNLSKAPVIVPDEVVEADEE